MCYHVFICFQLVIFSQIDCKLALLDCQDYTIRKPWADDAEGWFQILNELGIGNDFIFRCLELPAFKTLIVDGNEYNFCKLSIKINALEENWFCFSDDFNHLPLHNDKDTLGQDGIITTLVPAFMALISLSKIPCSDIMGCMT